MDIKKIDKNFMTSVLKSDGFRYYDVLLAPFELYGLSYDEGSCQFIRMPTSIAKNVSEGVEVLNFQTAGGRLKFSTNSNRINLKVELYYLSKMSNMALSGSASFCLCEETENSIKHIKTFMPEYNDDFGYERSAFLNGSKMRNYILYFPLYNSVKSISIGLDDGALVGAGKQYKDVLPILYYGSSITQGGCASRPDNSYQALISKWNNIDFINLGFSGSAKAENTMVDYFSAIPASVFVCDYDHNAENAAYLAATHYNLYAKYRKQNPLTPIIFVTKPDFYNDIEGLKRLEIIKLTYTKAKANNDNNVYFIDGRDLFGDTDRENCTVDGCHPTDLGFYRMAQVIGNQINQILK